MHPDWRNRNRCPYCTVWHPVTTMLMVHLRRNQCGSVPKDWAEKPPNEDAWKRKIPL